MLFDMRFLCTLPSETDFKLRFQSYRETFLILRGLEHCLSFYGSKNGSERTSEKLFPKKGKIMFSKHGQKNLTKNHLSACA